MDELERKWRKKENYENKKRLQEREEMEGVEKRK